MNDDREAFKAATEELLEDAGIDIHFSSSEVVEPVDISSDVVEKPKKLREKAFLVEDRLLYETIRAADIDGVAVGKRIYLLRKGKGLTIESFSAIIGYSKSSIWSWEYGKRIPSLDAVKKMCLLFGCSADFLIFGTGRSGWEI